MAPNLTHLPTFDLNHTRSARATIAQTGFAMTERVRWWGGRLAAERRRPSLAERYAALTDTWRGREALARCAPHALHMSQPLPLVQPADPEAVRYVAYQPSGSLGEWWAALRNAEAIARALNRTLVVPHVVGDGSASTRASLTFDLAPMRRHVPLIEMDDFRELGYTQPPFRPQPQHPRA